MEAANESDLYSAQGYVPASARLWQMDLLRRTARGELSEIFGRVTLEEDRRHRRYGFAVIADATFAQASPTMRASLEAYTRGVNAFIESRTDANLPPEFRLLQYRPRAWRPTDAVAMYKLIDEGFSNSWDRDIARAALSDLSPECMATIRAEVSPLDVIVVGSDGAAPSQSSSPVPMPCRAAASQSINPDALRELASIGEETTRSLARVGLYAEGLAASNTWLVSGRPPVTGKPLLAADPHITASAPSVWHMVHLTTPGLRVAGGTFPGMPGVVVGHNERIAWGFTNLDPDVQDVYLEKFDTADPHRYQTPEGWRTAEVRR